MTRKGPTNKQMLLGSIQLKDIEFISSTEGYIKKVNKDLVYPFIKDAVVFLAQEAGKDAEEYYENLEQIDLDIKLTSNGLIAIYFSGTLFDITSKLDDICLIQKIHLANSIYQSKKQESKNLNALKNIISETETDDWRLTQELFLSKENGGIGEKGLYDIFGTAKAAEIIATHSKSDLVELINNYKSDIQKDDVVRTAMGKEGIVLVVNNKYAKLLHRDFTIHTYSLTELTKTGRKCNLSKEI